jgi:hypothetical protein
VPIIPRGLEKDGFIIKDYSASASYLLTTRLSEPKPDPEPLHGAEPIDAPNQAMSGQPTKRTLVVASQSMPIDFFSFFFSG